MPRTDLTVNNINADGIDPAALMAAANVDGHAVANGAGDMFLVVTNGSGSSIDVTLITGAEFRGRALADDVVAVPAGATRWIGGLAKDLYDQPSGADRGKVYVDFSAVATVTVGAFRVQA